MRSIIFLLFLLPIFGACKKKPSAESVKSDSKPQREPALRSEIQAWPSPYWTAKGKIYVSIAGNNMPVNITLRAEEGKMLWFSASAFGLMEVARGRIDRDSVRILDKFNNRCFRSRLSGLGSYLPVALSIKQLQHFLMGRVFWDSLEAGRQRVSSDSSFMQGTQAGVAFSASIFKQFQLVRASANMGQTANVSMENNSFKDVSGFPIAFGKEINSRSENSGKTNDSKIRIEFSRFEFLKAAPEFDFSLPEDCTPMEIK
jgi:hypothetical protein